MKVKARIKFLRISPKKLKALGKRILGKSPQLVIDRLGLSSGKAGQLFTKVIKSALSNAVNNNKLDANTLRIKAVVINKGPFLKRWNPVSRGMAHSIKKRTSHIEVVLEEAKVVHSKNEKPEATKKEAA